MSVTDEPQTEPMFALMRALDSAPESAMTFAEAHGYLSAQAVQSAAMAPLTTVATILDIEPNAIQPGAHDALMNATSLVHQTIRQRLMQGEPVDLPCDPECDTDPEHPPLMAWSVGFMQAIFESPEDWHGTDDETLGEMTLPILAVSTLVDEPEFVEMAEDTALMHAFCDQIPELLIDLFLHFNAPVDA